MYTPGFTVTMTARNNNAYTIFTGVCPDEKCKMKLYFPYFEDIVMCHQCGQRHKKQSLKNIEEVKDIDSVFRNVLRGMLMNALPKRGTEAVKVLGLSNYHCKLLSPLLTKYGMDKETGRAKPLSEMNQGDIFDCGLFGDRAFLIDPEHISIPGFGRDVSGSPNYLRSTLDLIRTCNNNEERLVPIHADGDGHCLVHAISRALVGRELFWHPLRCSLKRHFEENLSSYKELFKDFVDESDWKAIVDECDPEFLPPEGELLGLRNIHVFGLANVLKRPIILLDTAEYMDKMGDYAALFLPSMVQPDMCKGKDNHLNKPLCIAWSSEGHNHYIPLVGIKKHSLPVLPRKLLPKVWGFPQDQIDQYIEFDENCCCTIGGDRSLGDPYILRLVSAMEELFFCMYEVHPHLVSDSHHYLYASTGTVGVRPITVTMNTQGAVKQGRLYRCLTCNAINEQVLLPEWFKKTGLLYNMALRSHGVLHANQSYAFPARGIFCKYDASRDELVPDLELSCLDKCSCCEGSSLRKVRPDGSIIYKNRDRTKTPSKSSLCSCGFKHYWEGREYDNLPQQINVSLEWNNRVVKDVVNWFQNESDPRLNSNVYQVAAEVVQKHFPGVFGSERLQQRVVDQILEQTKPPEIRSVAEVVTPAPSKDAKDDYLPSKIIIGGTGILHREELGVSSTEQKLLRRIESRAYHQQKRQALAKTESPEKSIAVVPTEGDNSKTYSPSLSESPVQKTVESPKFVRVVTHDGRQGKLDLGEGITFETLQKWIYENFQIAPGNQRIRHGFPPRVLHASSSEKGSKLSLSPGEKIDVEDFQPSKSIQAPKPGQGVYDSGTSVSHDWNKFVENLIKSEHDPLDAALVSFQIASSMSGLTPWEYSKTVPSLYEANGIFYQQMKRDVGLNGVKHGNLPMFPDKVFAYNPERDRIELCFEPYGHHQIEVGVEEKILKCEKERNLKSCSSGGNKCTVSGNLKKHADRVPFQGTGYTLKDSEVKSPQKERVIDDTCKIPLKSSASLVRKGPGFSVLSHSNVAENSSLDRLQGLACEIENDALLDEEESGDRSIQNSSSQDPPSSGLSSDSVPHMEHPTTLLPQSAVSTETSSGENYTVDDMPKNNQEVVSVNSEQMHVRNDPDLPQSKSGDEDKCSSHGDCSDHPMDDSARDCENVDMVLGKGEDNMCLTNSVLERNFEIPDDTQAMDIDGVVT